MGHTLELIDAQYETLRQIAEHDQETPEQLLTRMVDALITNQRTIIFTDEELLWALGAGDDEIAELAALETDPEK